jgi:CHAD domain-containing protein
MSTKFKGLTRTTSFEKSAFIILEYHFNVIRKKIKVYFKSPDIENLHVLRIAVRRLRYSMENFELVYRKKDFNKMIDHLKYLQDLIGEGRDLDVFEEKIKHLAEENELNIPEYLFKIIEEKKDSTAHNIKLDLMKLLNDKNLKLFFKTKL